MIAYFLAYNEIDLLPWQFKWCQNQGLEMFVIENQSTDGTKEFLIDNHIRHKTIDTSEAFDLRPLLLEMTRQIHTDKPDWFIYQGMDMFFVTSNISIKQLAAMANIMRYNMIALNQITFYHTSMQTAITPHKNPFTCNFHYRPNNIYTFISAYSPEISIQPDKISRSNKSVFFDKHGCIFEMHAAKPIKNRVENLKRRERAWNNGLNKNYGRHYLDLAKRDFIYPETEQNDIRDTRALYQLYSKLHILS